MWRCARRHFKLGMLLGPDAEAKEQCAGKNRFCCLESGQVYAAREWKEYDMLETERLLLRKWTRKTRTVYLNKKTRRLVRLQDGRRTSPREESLDVIRNVLNGRKCYTICKDPKAIGAIELILDRHNDTENHDEECELGYWLGKPFWGRGYMPEAAK